MTNIETKTSPQIIRSLVALILGSLVLRAAAGAMGENIQFYFNYINEAALKSDHALHGIAGFGNVTEISYTLGQIIITIFFACSALRRSTNRPIRQRGDESLAVRTASQGSRRSGAINCATDSLSRIRCISAPLTITSAARGRVL